jgi:hypothetical protein
MRIDLSAIQTLWEGMAAPDPVRGEFAVLTFQLQQIKIAQGAKPSEGGQLSGLKVDAVIARVRHSIAGVQLCDWFVEHDCQSVRQLQGSMSQKYCADPAAFERAQYMRAIMSYKPAR